MKLEEKISRWRELKGQEFLSDQDIEECARLEEEIQDELMDEKPRAKPNPHYKKQEEKNQYRGVITGRILKWRDERKEKNKATPEKIEQLKLEVEKATLERKLAEEKNKKNQAKWDKLGKVIGNGKNDDKLEKLLGSKSDAQRDKERDAYWKRLNNYKW